jgi:beta-galactosidase
VTVAAKAVEFRPQVAAWEREVPAGSGITGLWRPEPAAPAASGLLAMLLGDGTTVFTLHQDGSTLTGTVEGGGGGFFGGNDAPNPIKEGKVDGGSISFRAGNSTYSGTLRGDRIELERKTDPGFPMPHVEEPAGPRPAVGPPPDGSDPSRGPSSRVPPTTPVVLRRVQR